GREDCQQRHQACIQQPLDPLKRDIPERRRRDIECGASRGTKVAVGNMHTNLLISARGASCLGRTIAAHDQPAASILICDQLWILYAATEALSNKDGWS